MGKWLCRLGRHQWQQVRNPEVGGGAAVSQRCARCGKDRKEYGKPPARGVGAG